MDHFERRGWGRLGRVGALIAVWGALQPACAADAVTTWSSLVCSEQIGSFDPFVAAMMHAAMHDSLNAIDPRYARWTAAGSKDPAATGAVPEAAVAQAAYEVLMGSQPQNSEPIKTTLAAALAAVPDGPGKSAGVKLGKAIAAATLARRARDRDVVPQVFSQRDAPGYWRATPPGIDAPLRFGRYQPFSGAAALDIPVDGPPELGSPAYLAALAEVRSIGRADSTERTAAQTEAAQFFANQTSSLNFHDLAIRLLAGRSQPPNIWDSARTMTLMSIALSDAYILVWPAKERFHFWRPITAIRLGSPGVVPDPAWEPTVLTPQHPEHPSAHATECMTGATVLRLVFGTDTMPLHYVATDAFSQPARDYPGFSALAQDCANSRLWAGAHFRTANDAAQRLGEALATHVVGTLLRPIGKNP